MEYSASPLCDLSRRPAKAPEFRKQDEGADRAPAGERKTGARPRAKTARELAMPGGGSGAGDGVCGGRPDAAPPRRRIARQAPTEPGRHDGLVCWWSCAPDCAVARPGGTIERSHSASRRWCRRAQRTAGSARADCTVFPVDCVSHNAVAAVKRVARSGGKPYLALRSSGLTSFASALLAIAPRSTVNAATG